MSETLAQAIARYADRQSTASPYSTAVEGLHITRAYQPNPPVHRLMRPALCVVAQGAKWATFGEHRLDYRAGQALVVGVDAPSLGRVFEASPEKPCLAVVLELDLAVLRTVLEQMECPPTAATHLGGAVFVIDCNGPLNDCLLRLVQLLDHPQAISSLQPAIMREIAYWLLAGPHGDLVARMVVAQGPSERVMRAVRYLRERFAEVVRIEELADVARLSPTAFHRQFKAMVSLSPLQYQKRLRLLEARRLMTSQSVSAEAAADAVGYISASQFSREYARLFGMPPKRDAHILRSRLTSMAVDESQPEAEPILTREEVATARRRGENARLA
ncbi:AraC family transcriptional regulator [Dyella solisilvae]|uniref:AraC family transcriptional regulator n=1 Tax=Dyella solisilvae TaxID=1920168 RepID=A0A370K8P9_9GAMM|nr:AraC family transcriptional regulator [Dyella solisilvae]RDI99021.1 AraC family transcriptional regulator [Dyella solisilvae]